MVFDYTMRPGVVEHSNALALMRADRAGCVGAWQSVVAQAFRPAVTIVRRPEGLHDNYRTT